MMPGVGAIHWKHRAGAAGAQFLATEVAGLRWLRVAGGPSLPRVLRAGGSRLGIEFVVEGPATPQMGRDLGRRLAVMHAAGAAAFGSAPPMAPGPHGWIGDLPMSYAQRSGFVEFWALDRLAFTVRLARDRGGLSAAQATEADRFVADLLAGLIDAGPPVEPARVHGDLWSGNVLWGVDGRVWVIDPAAHGGHPESDLAMLELFGAPHVGAIRSGYAQVSQLADGWAGRVPLHQTWPLLVHAALFGGGYANRAMAALRRARG